MSGITFYQSPFNNTITPTTFVSPIQIFDSLQTTIPPSLQTSTLSPFPTTFFQTTQPTNDTEINIDDSCARIMVPSFFIIIIVVGFVGNLFVMLTVAMNKHMRNTTNVLIFNLALADMLFILICVPATGF